MTTHLALLREHSDPLPPEFADDDVRSVDSLVEHFISKFTEPGEIVFDPFAGYGTTLVVAERLGRLAFGVEIDQRRADYARSRVLHPERLIIGDSRRLANQQLPEFDFSFSSPPYMARGHFEDPLTGYRTEGRGYEAYLHDLRNTYRQLSQFMRPGARVALEVQNLKNEGVITTLAWDIAAELSEIFHFLGETVVTWDNDQFGFDHSYCLLYARR
jgi:hypothetical protein